MSGQKLITYSFVDPSVKSASDYKAQITLGVTVENKMMQIYCLNAWIRQDSIDAMLEMAWSDFAQWKLKVLGVEMIGFAALLEREYLRIMAAKGIPLPLHKVESVVNKQAKIESLVPIVRSGLIKFDPTQGDQGLLIRQFKAFPDTTSVSRGGLGDDGPDALYECFKLIQQFPAGSSMVEYKSGQKREARFKKGAF